MRFVVVAALILLACDRPAATTLSIANTRVERQRTFSRLAERAEALPGDWVVETERMRIIVGGLERPQLERCSIHDARMEDMPLGENLSVLAPALEVGRSTGLAEITDMRVIERNGRPVLRCSGRVAVTAGAPLTYARELTFSTKQAAIAISSSVAPAQGSIAVRLGTEIGWGAARPWLPGVGQLEDGSWREGAFVGVEGEKVGSVFGLSGAPLDVSATYDVHGGARFLRSAKAMGPRQRASRIAPATERALLVFSAGGMGAALRHFGWLRGQPFPEASAWLPYVPAGSALHVATAAGTPLLSVRPDQQGVTMIPLLPLAEAANGVYVVMATAHGHAESGQVKFVSGQRLVVDIPRSGHARVTVRNARTREPMVARVRFLPRTAGATLNLGPDWSAHGARDAVIVTGNDVTVPLPPGPYRVLITHGPEWTMHDELIDVSATGQVEVDAELAHVVHPGSFVGCELHVHAAASLDSRVSLQDRVASLVAEGVGFAVATDHNHVTDYGPSSDALGLHEGTFLTATGVEVTTSEPPLGHFNAYPVPPRNEAPNNGAPAWHGRRPGELFARLRTLGPEVAVQVNHPRMEGDIGYFDLSGYNPITGVATGDYSDDYDLLEVWNGFDLARASMFDRTFADWLAMVARGRHVTAVGNSDSHQIRYEWAGYPRTYVRTHERTPRGIVAALRAGHAFVTSGPFLEATVGRAGPGDVVRVLDGVAHVEVKVRAPSWMSVDQLEIWMDGSRAHQGSISAAPTTSIHENVRAKPDPATVTVYYASVDIRLEHDAGIVVLVRGERFLDDYFGRAGIPPLAFTNPIWVAVDSAARRASEPGEPVRREPDSGAPRR